MKENKNLKLKSICHSEEALATEESFNRFFAFAQNDGESGRSMVEMLGVLAVIGVLSVAGIAGYSIAMRSYRTNEIVNAASKLYVLGSALNQGNGDGTLTYASIAGSDPAGVSNLTYTNHAITMTIADKDDCAMVMNKLGDKANGDCTSANAALTVNFVEMEGETREITYEGEEERNEQGRCPHWNMHKIGNPSEGKCFDTEAHATAYCEAIGLIDIDHEDGYIGCIHPEANGHCFSYHAYICLEENGIGKVYQCYDPADMGDSTWYEQTTCSGGCSSTGTISSNANLCS